MTPFFPLRLVRPLVLSLAIGGCALVLSPAGAQDTAPTTDLKLGTASQKVPAGTLLAIVFNSRLDSRITETGEPFTATLRQDFISPEHVILPAGAIVRGRVDKVRRPGFFSRGGAIGLNFDHVMIPSGELIPLELNLAMSNKIVNKKGFLYSDPGIRKKVSQGAQSGKQTFTRIKDEGFETGRNTAGGLGVIVTVPAAIAGGALADAAVTTQKAAVAVVGKGDSVIINPGDVVTIDFGGAFSLPTQ